MMASDLDRQAPTRQFTVSGVQPAPDAPETVLFSVDSYRTMRLLISIGMSATRDNILINRPFAKRLAIVRWIATALHLNGRHE